MFGKLLSAKALFVYGLFIVLGGLSFAIYLQFFKGLGPCALCIFQRLTYIAYGLIALVAIIHSPKKWGARVYAFFQLPVTLLGLAIALRQVWLQGLPPGQVPSCGPGINFLLQSFPLQKVVQVVWAGSSDCAVVSWRFLTLSMATWSAILFGCLFLLSLFAMLKRYQTGKKKSARASED